MNKIACGLFLYYSGLFCMEITEEKRLNFLQAQEEQEKLGILREDIIKGCAFLYCKEGNIDSLKGLLVIKDTLHLLVAYNEENKNLLQVAQENNRAEIVNFLQKKFEELGL